MLGDGLMEIEFRRLKNNKNGVLAILSCILCFILGYFLLITLDGYTFTQISLSQLQYSIYTVFSQFGFFIFPVLSTYLISSDYKDANIAFYQTLGKTATSYYINKIISLTIFISIGNLISAIFISLLYKDFSNLFLFMLKIENVSIFIVFISSLCAFIFKNTITAFCVNFGIWILSIVLSSIHNFFKVLCFYDASLSRHSEFEQILNTYNSFDISILIEVSYNIIILLIVILIIKLLNKRWIKNGI